MGKIPLIQQIPERAESKIGKDSIYRAMLSLAWPVILTNLLVTITSVINIIMVGKLGPIALASVGLGSQVIFLIWTPLMTIGVATTALISRSIGKRDFNTANNVLRQSLILGILLSIPLVIIGTLSAYSLLSLFGAEREVVTTGTGYLQIVFLATAFVPPNFLSAAALNGAGDTKTPLYVGALTNAFHILLNYVLIFGNFGFPALGVNGAALGTGFSYLLGTFMYLGIFLKKRTILTLTRGKSLSKEIVKRLLKISLPATLEQTLMRMAIIGFTVIIMAFGTIALAAHQVGLSILMLAFLPGFGFATAGTILVGQKLGAKNPVEAERCGWESGKLAVLMMVTIGILLFLIARPIAFAFVEDIEVVNLAVFWIRMLSLSLPVTGIEFALAGALRGAGDTRRPLYALIIGSYGCRLPLALFLGFGTWLGLYGVWSTLIVDHCVRSAYIVIKFKSGKWKYMEV